MSIYDRIAAQLRQPTGIFGRYVMTAMLNRGNAELIDATLACLELASTDTYCDIGFGGGRSLRKALRVVGSGHVYGVDFSPDVVVAGQRNFRSSIADGRVHLLVADVAELPLRDELFVKVSTVNTIYFWPTPQVAMASLFRVLCPGGKLAIGFTGAQKMESYGQITQNFTKYTSEQVQVLMAAAGFEDIIVVPQFGKRSRGDSVVHGRKPTIETASAL